MIAELSFVPLSSDENLEKYYDEAKTIVEASGLKYENSRFGVVIEGEWREVMRVAKSCHQKMTEMSDRVSTNIRLDHSNNGQ